MLFKRPDPTLIKLFFLAHFILIIVQPFWPHPFFNPVLTKTLLKTSRIRAQNGARPVEHLLVAYAACVILDYLIHCYMYNARGIARHCNYLGDLLLALSFSLPCGIR